MKNSGFSLTEVMIVVAIVAIILTLAMPSYERFIRKSKRADVQLQMIELASAAERLYTEKNSYADIDNKDGEGLYLFVPLNDDYTFSFSVAATATVYTIKATPKTGQASDGCGAMTLNQAGQRTKTGSEKDCW